MTLRRLKEGDGNLPVLLREMKRLIETSKVDAARCMNNREFIVTFYQEEDRHDTEIA